MHSQNVVIFCWGLIIFYDQYAIAWYTRSKASSSILLLGANTLVGSVLKSVVLFSIKLRFSDQIYA